MTGAARQPDPDGRWEPWDASSGTHTKDTVPVEIGGSTDTPPHPPLSWWQRLEVHYLVPSGMAVIALGVPAAAAVILGKWLGGAALGAVVAVLVVVVGVYLAKRPPPPEHMRALQRAARERGAELTSDQAWNLARRRRLLVGSSLAVAGGIGLALAFAAL